MKSHEVREAFINYFKKQGHTPVESSSLIPENDPTLLFTNAGMNQFKNVFLGLEKRSYKRAVTAQKCVRAGGKHNDLENVGFTARHHTFFEMLGNFSFGDYFKRDAIQFGWEFATKTLSLPKDRLYVSVFEKDDEAADFWHKDQNVPKDRIYRFGEKDNFWRMGNTGPCGPCSEIFYDLGEEVGGDPKANVMGGDGDRYIEFWNLVFMQFNESEGGKQEPLPNPSIDTGAGLERISAIMQGQLSNYHTDLFQAIIHQASKVSKVEYLMDLKKYKDNDLKKIEQSNVALRVLADHARATAFLMSDGVLPSNEGRGYVLRRIMRRAIRYGRNLTDQSVFPSVVQEVISQMGGFYTQLQDQQKLIMMNCQDEEQRFLATLDQGMHILTDNIKKMDSHGQKMLPGDLAFKLYDTFGFPLDLTRLIAREHGLDVNERDFETRMEEARQVAKASWKNKGLTGDAAHLIQLSQSQKSAHGPTEFLGYNDVISAQGSVQKISNGKTEVKQLKNGETGILILDRTCFYAESGGQVGDTGSIITPHGQAEVLDCTKQNDIHLHHVRMVDGTIALGELATLKVNDSQRRQTAANHSATHLLHSALRKVLGTHITQAGSLVESERLRFDFTHNKSLTMDEIQQIENLVNDEIAKSQQVGTSIMAPKEATAAGALALFGEKYGDKVRVIQMGEFSKELCGGTHVSNTGLIRLFKIVSEGGVSAGVRRIEALTSDNAVKYLLKNTRENLQVREATGLSENWQSYILNANSSPVVAWVETQKNELKNLGKEIQKSKISQVNVDELVSQSHAFQLSGQKSQFVWADIETEDRNVLSEISDKIKNKIQSGLVVTLGKGSNSHPIIVSVTKNLVGPLNAGQILKEIATIMGGKGGGRPDFAQGAVPIRDNSAEALKKTKSLIGLS